MLQPDPLAVANQQAQYAKPAKPEQLGPGGLIAGDPRVEPIDGFSLNAELRNWPYWFYPIALQSLAALRTSEVCAYRHQWYSSPFDVTNPIPAASESVETIQVVPGSIFYAITFAALDGDASDYFIQLTNLCTNANMWSGRVSATAGNTSANPATPLVLLCEPIRIGDPGLIQARITNNRQVAGEPVESRAQLLLWMADPCVVVLRSGGEAA